MSEKLEKLLEKDASLPYDWLEDNNLLDELPSPIDDGLDWVPKNEWRDNMFYSCKFKHWVYRPEES